MAWGVTNSSSHSSDEVLRAQQRQKKADLINYTRKGSDIIEKIKKINKDIIKANKCADQIIKIPGIMQGTYQYMGATGGSLQKGLSINGKPVGQNISDNASNMANDTQNKVNLIINKIQEYATRKNVEGNQKLEEVMNIRKKYNSRLSSYPKNLGSYGPAPIFPFIIDVESVGNPYASAQEITFVENDIKKQFDKMIQPTEHADELSKLNFSNDPGEILFGSTNESVLDIYNKK